MSTMNENKNKVSSHKKKRRNISVKLDAYILIKTKEFLCSDHGMRFIQLYEQQYFYCKNLTKNFHECIYE